MAPQSPALRSVAKQAHGVAASAAVRQTAGYLWRGELYPRKRRPARAPTSSLTGVSRSLRSMLCVFVVDAAQHPRTPVHPGTARRLLTKGQAAVWRRHPFTIILHGQCPPAPPAVPAPLLRLKLDPGS